MNTFLIYVIKSSIYLFVLYLVYWLLLSRDTAYGRNRIYLLLSVLLAFILPLITSPIPGNLDQKLFGKWFADVVISANGTHSGESSFLPGPGLIRIINTIYIAGVAFFIIKFIVDLSNLVFLIIRKGNVKDRIIRYHTFRTAGFSAMGYIFLNADLPDEEAEEIIRHERNHLKKNHFSDVIFLELTKAFQWFNPAIHLLNRSLRAVHEYEADNECLRSGSNLHGYQELLIKQIFRSGSLSLSNSFANPSMTRKRMLMMTRNKTSSIANLKILAVIPAALLTFALVTASGKKELTRYSTDPPANLDETPFVVVEVMPEFPGGDAELLKFIGEHTVYPEAAKANNITGRVILRFCVTSTGSVDKITIISNTNPLLNEEAIRVANSLPRFKPGMQGGKPVPVWYMVPVTFTLK